MSYHTSYWFGFPDTNSDILLNLTHWQYWWWFWFTYLLCLYYFVFLKLIRNRSLKFHPKIVTSYRAHGKWGDFIICLLPISWCMNILSNSNFILRMLEWQTESNLFTVRIRGKQWYWIYKIEIKTLLNINEVPKNVGNNHWISFNSTNLSISDNYINLLQIKMTNKWRNSHYDKYLGKNDTYLNKRAQYLNLNRAYLIPRRSKKLKIRIANFLNQQDIDSGKILTKQTERKWRTITRKEVLRLGNNPAVKIKIKLKRDANQENINVSKRANVKFGFFLKNEFKKNIFFNFPKIRYISPKWTDTVVLFSKKHFFIQYHATRQIFNNFFKNNVAHNPIKLFFKKYNLNKFLFKQNEVKKLFFVKSTLFKQTTKKKFKYLPTFKMSFINTPVYNKIKDSTDFFKKYNINTFFFKKFSLKKFFLNKTNVVKTQIYGNKKISFFKRYVFFNNGFKKLNFLKKQYILDKKLLKSTFFKKLNFNKSVLTKIDSTKIQFNINKKPIFLKKYFFLKNTYKKLSFFQKKVFKSIFFKKDLFKKYYFNKNFFNKINFNKRKNSFFKNNFTLRKHLFFKNNLKKFNFLEKKYILNKNISQSIQFRRKIDFFNKISLWKHHNVVDILWRKSLKNSLIQNNLAPKKYNYFVNNYISKNCIYFFKKFNKNLNDDYLDFLTNRIHRMEYLKKLKKENRVFTNIFFNESLTLKLYNDFIDYNNRYLRPNFFKNKDFLKINFLNNSVITSFNLNNSSAVNKSNPDNIYLVIKQKRYEPVRTLKLFTKKVDASSPYFLHQGIYSVNLFNNWRGNTSLELTNLQKLELQNLWCFHKTDNRKFSMTDYWQKGVFKQLARIEDYNKISKKTYLEWTTKLAPSVFFWNLNEDQKQRIQLSIFKKISRFYKKNNLKNRYIIHQFDKLIKKQKYSFKIHFFQNEHISNNEILKKEKKNLKIAFRKAKTLILKPLKKNVKDNLKIIGATGLSFNEQWILDHSDFLSKRENKLMYRTRRKKINNFINLNNRRLLRTKRILVLPSNINITLITNSFDVVHSWYVPGLGIKMDCIPGRSTHHSIHIDHAGFYYGQCAEICGRHHHHMPIRICALPFEQFLIWWYHYGIPYFTAKTKETRPASVKNNIRQYSW